MSINYGRAAFGVAVVCIELWLPALSPVTSRQLIFTTALSFFIIPYSIHLKQSQDKLFRTSGNFSVEQVNANAGYTQRLEVFPKDHIEQEW